MNPKAKEKKEREKNKTKTIKFRKIKKKGEIPSLPTEENFSSLWEKAVEEIRKEDYPSFKEAKNAVIDRIITTFNLKEEKAQEIRQFLELVIDTDPLLQESIEKELAIKER